MAMRSITHESEFIKAPSPKALLQFLTGQNEGQNGYFCFQPHIEGRAFNYLSPGTHQTVAATGFCVILNVQYLFKMTFMAVSGA
jgi:hypothetical protein